MKNILIGLLSVWLLPAAAVAQPLMLSQAQCREMALQNNEDLQKADNAYEQARLDKLIAFTSYLPKFDGNFTTAYMLENMDVLAYQLKMKGTYMAGITLTQPIYTGGKIRTGNRLARIGKDCADESRRKTRMQVIADADCAYWTYIAVNEKIKMLQTICRQLDTIYTQTKQCVDAQMATENDLLRIEAKRSEIYYQLQKTRNGGDLCRLSLCSVLGLELETDIVPTDTVIPVTPPAEMDESISQRPELKLLEKQIEANRQQIKMTRADILPTVGLSVGYTYYGNLKLDGMATDGMGNYFPFTQEFKAGFTVGMASVSVPLFHWGEGLKKIKKARLSLDNARLDLQKNARLLTIEVRQAIQNVTDGYNMIKTAELGQKQAGENLRVMTNRYNASMCTLTDLLDAETQWQTASSNLIEAQSQYRIYQTEYLRASGRLE